MIVHSTAILWFNARGQDHQKQQVAGTACYQHPNPSREGTIVTIPDLPGGPSVFLWCQKIAEAHVVHKRNLRRDLRFWLFCFHSSATLRKHLCPKMWMPPASGAKNRIVRQAQACSAIKGELNLSLFSKVATVRP